MDSIKAINIKNILVEETGGGKYVSDRVFEREKMKDLDYISEIIAEMMRLKNINNQINKKKKKKKFIFTDSLIRGSKCSHFCNTYPFGYFQGSAISSKELDPVDNPDKARSHPHLCT